jgi:PIN domain nuclease of toxin-antitoxin system
LSPTFLSPQARAAIAGEGNSILVSAASAWEIAAQSLALDIPVLSPDPQFDQFGVRRIW